VTLNRLFSIHFLLPFVLIVLSSVHLIFLHNTTSSNPSIRGGFNRKILFHPIFRIKDLIGIIISIALFFLWSILYSNYLIDGENFIKANSLVTPVHIKPE
jgi:ubiquinol-cytochrome c reductase cytochrome b subunit